MKNQSKLFGMLRKLFLLIVLVAGTSLQAQQSNKAKALLDEVSAKVKSYDNMVIKFSYIQESATDKRKQETNGCVELEGEKYKLDLMGTTRIFDGKKIYDIIPEDEEVNIASYNPNDDKDLSPSKMLSFFEKGYQYKWDISQNVEGRMVQFVKLTPEDKNAEIKEVYLGIDAQTKHINKMIQLMKDGAKITIAVKSFKTNQPLSQNTFKFNENKYNGFYINRLD